MTSSNTFLRSINTTSFVSRLRKVTMHCSQSLREDRRANGSLNQSPSQMLNAGTAIRQDTQRRTVGDLEEVLKVRDLTRTKDRRVLSRDHQQTSPIRSQTPQTKSLHSQ